MPDGKAWGAPADASSALARLRSLVSELLRLEAAAQLLEKDLPSLVLSMVEHVHLGFGLPVSGGAAASVSAAETTITTAATAAVVLRKLAAEPMNAATMACCEPLFAVACSLLEAELTSPTPLAVTLAEEEQLKERITGLQHLLECVTVLAPALLSAVVAVSDNPQKFEEKWIAQGQLMRFEVQPCLAGGRAEHWKRCAQLLYRCAVLALNIPPTLLPDQMHPALATEGARMLGCIAVANAICCAEHKPPAASLSALPGFGLPRVKGTYRCLIMCLIWRFIVNTNSMSWRGVREAQRGRGAAPAHPIHEQDGPEHGHIEGGEEGHREADEERLE
jgi:hypothetical protein